MRKVLTLLFALLAFGAHAEPVLVLSGEHETHSRLVVYLAPGQDWSLEDRDADGASIRVDDNSDGYDISRVFDKIPRTRLIGIDASGDDLNLQLGCACELVSEVLETGHLVIDIFDAGNAPVVAQETTERRTIPATSGIAPAPLWRQEPRRNLAGSVAVFTEPEPDEPTPAADLSELRKTLVEQIGRAGSQSFLDVAEIPLPQDPPRNQDLLNQPERQVAEPVIETAPTRLRVATIEDPAPRQAVRRGPDTATCYPGAHFDISAWGDQRPYGAQIGDIRRALTGEFDRFLEKDALALARLYVFFGMGPEARQTVSQYQLSSQTARSVEAIAHLMDGKADALELALSQMTECDGPIALWASLAAGAPERITQAQSRAVTSEFSSLPRHLRDMIAPRLIAKFTDAGDDTGAAILRNALERDGANPSAAVTLSQVEPGAIERGELLEIVEQNSENSPEALLRLLQADLASEGPIDPKLIDLAGALAQENYGRAISPELKHLEILARARNGSFGEAFAELERRDRREVAKWVEALEGVATAAYRDAALRELSSLALALIDADLVSELGFPAVKGLANRFVEAGMPALARQVLDASPQGADDPLLLSQIYAAQGQLSRAQDVLPRGDQGPYDAARARLMLRDGLAEVALQELGPNLSGALQAQIAWNAESWADLAGGETAQAQVAEIMLEEQNASFDDTKPLAQAGEILRLSQNARAALDALITPSQAQ